MVIDYNKIKEDIEKINDITGLESYRKQLDIGMMECCTSREYPEGENQRNTIEVIKDMLYAKEVKFIPTKKGNKCWGCPTSERGHRSGGMYCSWCDN